MNKPFVIEMDEAKKDLVSVVDRAIQERKIPCYVLEILLGDILSQVQEVARREREIANQSYLKQFATEENPTEENEETTEG